MAVHESSITTRDWTLNRPELDTSPMEVIGALKRATGMLARLLEPLYATSAIAEPEHDVLVVLRHRKGPVIARHVAEELGVSQAWVSRMLRKLEERGYVRREANANDRRAAIITMTDSGRSIVDELFPERLRIEAEALAGLGDERAAVVAGLERLVATLKAYEG
ncbi:MarR family transcriptional regulator [Mycobacteroides abscessus subsp. bolletii]|uniref:MarR family winged helix-turn-helix transcriptional regulator n=1 Tax=Mycobacteroides abscessus TaxID=36809 RepID=UPI0019D2F970|nr:MarR family transcriptional regulator [Mycobacteroides abscessus]MBN7304533.1 MarR family transcriptional regulator [Mycobacteroides abscessus subsp. bolletii]